MTTQQLSKQELLQQAHEAEVEEAALVDQLNHIPSRVAQAKRDAESRFNIATMELRSGRSTHVPTLDYSEASSIQSGEAELKASAKAAGLRKLRLYAAYHRAEEAEHQAVYDKLGSPLEDLEQQALRINNDLKAMKNARVAVDKRRRDAWSQALSYERAATFHEQADDVFVRMG